MKKKEYIQPELAVVEVELQRMIANSPGYDPDNTTEEVNGNLGREDGFFGF